MQYLSSFYTILFFISLVLSLFYVRHFHKHFQTAFSLVFAFIPISILGFVFRQFSTTLEGALFATCMIYLSGCYLPLLIMLIAFSLCHVKLLSKITFWLFVISTLLYLSILSIGSLPIFYKNITTEMVNGYIVVHREYGPAHLIFYIYIGALTITSFVTMIYAYLHKNDISKTVIILLFIPFLLAIFSYFGGHFFSGKIEFTPLSYVLAQIIYLIIIHKICLYDIADTGIDSLIESGQTGFVSLDFKLRYLGSNETARRFMPELNNLHTDVSILKNPLMQDTVVQWIKVFADDENIDKFHFNSDDKIYLVDINYLYDGTKKRGYQLFITDDTQSQKYIDLLNKFNTNLQNEVDLKTNHIVEMHNQFILGMATMVESRDNSTGGHIRRTSDIVRILIEEMTRKNELQLSAEFCKDIIKAAPMHDLGKIAVDDQILRKPGRFTDEEYEIMKKHSAEGAKIIAQILKDSDDLHFKQIAENVAHYHHEKYDGSGYPEGLKGEDIPLEARIMAIADVYDALVSKRVYKESMSFEAANKIMTESFGSHFDKKLESYYLAAREKFENYYRENDK
ncbi:MAG: HD domain-containing protein [Treponema sp.]|nr:HD domain-containing protein [Treponema sp.]